MKLVQQCLAYLSKFNDTDIFSTKRTRVFSDLILELFGPHSLALVMILILTEWGVHSLNISAKT